MTKPSKEWPRTSFVGKVCVTKMSKNGCKMSKNVRRCHSAVIPMLGNLPKNAPLFLLVVNLIGM